MVRTTCLVVVCTLLLLTVYTAVGFRCLLDVRACPSVGAGKRPPVFGIGLPRTGTCSLSQALVVLGRRVQHFPYRFADHTGLYLDRKDAFVDVTIMGVRPSDILAVCPDAIFIYTPRDNTSWLRSMRKLHGMLVSYGRVASVARQISLQFVRTFGPAESDWLEYKRRYEQVVYRLQRAYPGRCTVLDILRSTDDASTWRQLAASVGAPGVPAHTPFPRRSELEYHLVQFWGNMLSRARV